MYNNCPHASSEIVEKFEELKAEDYKNRRVKKLLVRLVTAQRLRLKTQKELDDHRRGGHAQYSPDCPECKRGAAKKRPHRRLLSRMGGELSVDISGPFVKG